MKLTVVSNLEHYLADGAVLGAWPAAVREVEALASLCDEVVHVACLHPGQAPPQAIPHQARNLGFEWLPPAGGRGWSGKLHTLRAMPQRLAAIDRAWADADAVLVRSPSNASAAALALFSLGRGPARRWVKYAGAWQGRAGEKLAYRLQRWWLRSGFCGAAVTIGGVEDSLGAAALCNPSLSASAASAGDAATRDKRIGARWRLLCVGRLVPDKGVDVAIRVIALLRRRGFDVELDVAGDGPQRGGLECLADGLCVRECVRFHGWLAGRQLDGLYERAHALLAPSQGEGWARAWTDAAARRCVPVVAAVGGAPGLERLGAGLMLESRCPQAWADRVQRLLADEARWQALAQQGPALARSFTYERFRERAGALLGLDRAPAALCEEGA